MRPKRANQEILRLRNDHLIFLFQVCSESSKVTHYHPSGINYAILQAAAVKTAAQTEPGTLDPITFIETLTAVIQPRESSDQFQDREKPAIKGYVVRIGPHAYQILFFSFLICV